MIHLSFSATEGQTLFNLFDVRDTTTIRPIKNLRVGLSHFSICYSAALILQANGISVTNASGACHARRSVLVLCDAEHWQRFHSIFNYLSGLAVIFCVYFCKS